ASGTTRRASAAAVGFPYAFSRRIGERQWNQALDPTGSKLASLGELAGRSREIPAPLACEGKKRKSAACRKAADDSRRGRDDFSNGTTGLGCRESACPDAAGRVASWDSCWAWVSSPSRTRFPTESRRATTPTWAWSIPVDTDGGPGS